MKLTDIIGPVMVGPSSSHTAGAVKIGNICRKLLGEPPIQADIYFHGSFQRTGKGHGTDKAIIAGLLGFAVDDIRIPYSFQYAKQQGLQFHLSCIDLGDAHPNSLKLVMTGKKGKRCEVIAASVGGGRIMISRLDGWNISLSGDYPTLIVRHLDCPGQTMEVTSVLGRVGINIAAMQLHRESRGGAAMMVLECDQELGEPLLRELKRLTGVVKVIYLSMAGEDSYV